MLLQWDYDTSMEEVMNGLHNLVTSGKVLYLVSPRAHCSRPESRNGRRWLTVTRSHAGHL